MHTMNSTLKVAQTIDEDCKLLEVGFEYVKEIDETQVFKKRKESYTL